MAAVMMVWGDVGAASAAVGDRSAPRADRVPCDAGRVAHEDRSVRSKWVRESLHEQMIEVRGWLAKRIGAFRHPVCVKLLTRELPRNLLAHAGARSLRGGRWVPRRSGRFEVCLVRVSARERLTAGRRLQGLLAHELAHCRQVEVMSLRRFTAGVAHLWLTEGSAEYLSVKRAGLWRPELVDLWRQYAAAPERSLFERRYDAAGFFWHVARRVDRPFRVIRTMWRAWRGRSARLRNRSAFAVARRAGGGGDFVRSWATGFMRRPDWGPEWELQGFGLPQGSGAPTLLDLQPGQREDGTLVAEAAVGVYLIAAPAGSVVQVIGRGAGRLRGFGSGSPDRRLAGDFELTYCVQSCRCADGTDLGRSMPTTEGTVAAAAFSNAPRESYVRAALIDPPCTETGNEPSCPSPGPNLAAHPGGMASRNTAAFRHQPCGALPPCDRFPFSPPQIAAMIKNIRDNHPPQPWPPESPNPPQVIPPGFPATGNAPFARRGCMWLTNYGDLFHVYEVIDDAALRQHLATLQTVAVGDQGWIEAGADPNVFFRVGTELLGTYILVTDLEEGEAISFATTVAQIARASQPG